MEEKPAPVEEKPKAEEKKPEPPVEVEKAKEEVKVAPKSAAPKVEEKKPEKPEEKTIAAKADSLKGLTVLGKIELPADKKKPKPVASSDDAKRSQEET